MTRPTAKANAAAITALQSTLAALGDKLDTLLSRDPNIIPPTSQGGPTADDIARSYQPPRQPVPTPLAVPADALASIPTVQPMTQPMAQPMAQPLPQGAGTSAWDALARQGAQELAQPPQPIPMGAPTITPSGSPALHNCEACGQRLRKGTVDVRTGEYIPSGSTTAWLKGQTRIIVALSSDGFQYQREVSGEWLASELKRRQPKPDGGKARAVSVPGFLCGEPSSTCATVRLIQPILRRATEDEERAQYIARLKRAAGQY